MDGYSESSYSATPRFAAARLPWFYCVPPKLYAYYRELAEDAELNAVADERMKNPEIVKVNLDDL
ncbi:hypothetical protein AB2G98_25385 (plasmid) [Escherichia coli]